MVYSETPITQSPFSKAAYGPSNHGPWYSVFQEGRNGQRVQHNPSNAAGWKMRGDGTWVCVGEAALKDSSPLLLPCSTPDFVSRPAGYLQSWEQEKEKPSHVSCALRNGRGLSDFKGHSQPLPLGK